MREAWQQERPLLQPLPTMEAPFDVVVTRRVQRDCLVSFEGRRYSVPFAWVGRRVDIWGTQQHVVIRGERAEIARHLRKTRHKLLIDPQHYEGPSTDRVERPTPLGVRARLQIAGLPGPSHRGTVAPAALEPALDVSRSMDVYASLVDRLAAQTEAHR